VFFDLGDCLRIEANSAQPLAVLSTYLALLYRNSHSPTLPKPGGHNGVTRPKSQLRHSVQLFILSLLGISSLYLFVALQNGSSILLLFLSVLATSSSFFLLDTCNDYNKQLPLPKLMEAIVLRVCLILLGVLLVIPPPSMLAWSMILQAFCTSAGLTATVCLVCFAAPLNQYGARLTQCHYPAGTERSHPCSYHHRLILCRRSSRLSSRYI
jgi:hypothetical protein